MGRHITSGIGSNVTTNQARLSSGLNEREGSIGQKSHTRRGGRVATLHASTTFTPLFMFNNVRKSLRPRYQAKNAGKLNTAINNATGGSYFVTRDGTSIKSNNVANDSVQTTGTAGIPTL